MPGDKKHRRVRVPRVMREQLFLNSEGRCQRCQAPIVIETFHAAHLRAVASGGPTVLENLEAWCPRCNWTQGPQDLRDTRWPPLAWQLEGLTDPDIPRRIIRQGTATVAAGPGSGKTVYAAMVFEALWELGFCDRMVVFVPRDALVDQWQKEVYTARGLDLTPGEAHERTNTMGCIVTYQSLNARRVEIHKRRAEAARTLVVFDEVHHLGEPVRASAGRPAWARYAMDLVGEIDVLKVAGVLNLSGTPWRSAPGQRISTVRYESLDDRLLSMLDFDVPSERLIREGRLRPVDLYRQGATVELVDLTEATRIVGNMTDLDEAAARAALRELSRDAEWRQNFVGAVLDRLERAFRDLEGAPVKGLIVAVNQAQARALQETANALMRQRGLSAHFTDLAISDDPHSARTLRHFKMQRRPGLLSTCDQAGEGYDCPEIIVLGYASNKLTALYVRQVVARAQRVTAREREKYGRPLPAAIVVPDVPALVEHMKNILQPMRHEIAAPPESEPGGPPGPGPAPPRLLLTGVIEIRQGSAHVTGVVDGEVEMQDVLSLEPHLRAVGLPELQAPRILWAARVWARAKREDSPFDPLSPEDQRLAASGPEVAASGEVRVEPLAESETAARWQAQLAALERWWSQHGSTPIHEFAAEANRAAGIPSGGRPRAALAVLQVAYRWARDQIVAHCETTGVPLPAILRISDDDQ
jgi:superfamily II DNA or RNA helicase